MKKTPLTIGSTTLQLGPLLAATLRDHKEQIALANTGKLEPLDMVDLAVVLGTAAAQRIDPKVTEEDLLKLVDLENFGRVLAACWGVSVPEGGPAAKKTRVKPSRSS